jgi:gliding motility associated protien GldN
MKRLSILLCCGMAFFCPSLTFAQEVTPAPIDGVVKKTLITERQALSYEPVREADILWEKKIWRVIDTREKINLPFSYPNQTFFDIINKAVLEGKIRAYSTANDHFTMPLTKENVKEMIVRKDTITVFNDLGEEEVKVVDNELGSDAVQKFKIKEDWFFDKESGTMEVRILGFAPLLDVYDENGNFRFTRPLYWVYYPDCRNTLAKVPFVSVADNDANPMSWEDAIEMRMFSSYITKESNIYDRRLEDYVSGVDLLLEGQKIHNGIFNFEHDMWSF